MHFITNMIAIAGLSAVTLSPQQSTRQTDISNPIHSAITIDFSSSKVKQGDINSLLKYFDETTKELEKQVKDLSQTQLQFKPAPDKWSISQCLEHIILSEHMLFEMAKNNLAKAPQPERKSEVKVSDNNFKGMVTDRSQKFQAPKELRPTGIYKDTETALTVFNEARKPVIDYIKKANIDELRNHIDDYPTGVVDGYQELMFIASHCARHTKQIEEVKANPNFPKE